MREFSVPATIEVGPDEALTDLLAKNVAEVGDQTGFRVRRGGALAGRDLAGVRRPGRRRRQGPHRRRRRGRRPGRADGQDPLRVDPPRLRDLVRRRGHRPDLRDLSAEQVAWILSDSGATAVVVESDEHAAAVESVRDQAPDLKSVHVIDDDAVGTLTQAGKDVPDSELEARRATLTADTSPR